ncbi:peptide/nickel transport system ATP-binding protein/oligopeptide transport system ATP-binding protein [Streptomyces sp. TverLS-915]|uniref:ABC transporter ATP-binding protein n=1 Tax=Streptomyces sp. TverLS-915 TaxID=1839763 RepID=UPI00081DE1DE|nr:oligopeptide/dipeptide ABC transporter ATP-binding protein [Streptomyces sp. TverLS-915]SCD66234.1 peptide/nickel transport system ATP-binding protein/oligopeptide transport system ATP-binding protein [Streptomyces sp. TverLS-915]
MTTRLLALEDVKQAYKPKGSTFGARRTGTVRAVDGVTLDVTAGETVGLVGESGCGKSSLAKLIVGLEQPASGRVLWKGRDVAAMSRAEKSAFHRGVQLIFQDPFASLNPRRTIRESIAEGILTHKSLPRQRVHDRVDELMADVGLDPAHADKYPHECSGGQLQRVGIARALALGPDLLVCDEPVSALDISVRAQVLNLLNGLKRKHGLTIVFIAHDLDVVQHMSDRIVTMYLGKIVEEGPCDAVYGTSAHPYTRALLSAVPKRLPPGHRIDRVVLEGDPPSPIDPPPGCPFHTRCYTAVPDCASTVPALTEIGAGHRAACLRADDVRSSQIGLPYRAS